MRLVSLLPVLFATAFCGLACETESEPTWLPDTPRDQLARGLGETLCRELGPCCNERGFEEPADGCRTAMRNAVMTAIIFEEEERRELIPSAVGPCIERFRAAVHDANDCGALPTPGQLRELCPDAFSAIPPGIKDPGSDCMRIHECSAPSEGERGCSSLSSTGPVCTWFLPAGENEACATSLGVVPVCPEGLFCGPPPVDDLDQTLRCRGPVGAFEPCAVSAACPTGYACAGDPNAKTCEPRVGPKLPCTAFDACVEDYFCDAVSRTCEAFPDPCADGGCDSIIYESACR